MKKAIFLFLCLAMNFIASAQFKYVYKASQQWVRKYDFLKQDDIISGQSNLTFDDSNNIYISGSCIKDTFVDPGWLIAKYNANGKNIWVNVDSHFHNIDQFASIGNYLMWDSIKATLINAGTYSGNAGGVGGFTDIVINRNNLAGQYLYDISYPPNNDATDASVSSGCLDSKGNAYITGYVDEAGGKKVASYVFKFDLLKAAPLIWGSLFDSSIQNEGKVVVADAKMNVYMSGTRGDANKNSTIVNKLHTMKLDSSGKIIWSQSLNYPDSTYTNTPTGIVLDKNNNIYVSAIYYNSTLKSNDGMVFKYSNAGQLKWIKKYSSLVPGTRSAVCNGISIDKSGGLYSIGYNLTKSEQYATLLKLDSLGNKIWMDTTTITEKGNTGFGEAAGITLDDTGNVYVTGSQYYSGIKQNVYTARYNSTGALQWYITYNDSDNNYNYPLAIRLDKLGAVIVAGIHDGDTVTGKDVLLLKYIQSRSKVSTTDVPGFTELNSSFSIFPNPFHNQFYGNLNLDKTSTVEVKLYDLVGREIKSWPQGLLQEGQHQLSFNTDHLATGVYYYTCIIQNTNGISTLNGKLVKE